MTPMFISGIRTLHIVFFVSALTIFGACDNSFDPVNTDNSTYSVHGMLDLMAETSYIRVKDLNTPFTLEATEELNAIVTLNNLDSGENTLLSSTIREYRGVYLHTFNYDEKVFPDTRYLLRVENSSGIQVELDVLTPTLPVPQITRDNDACTTQVRLVFRPMNGGVVTIRFGTQLDTESEDGKWGNFIFKLGPSTDSVGWTFTPLIFAQGTAGSFSNCSSILSTGYIYVAVAHYSPGFYEQINDDVTDILETTRRLGGFYADTLAIPVDTSL